MSKRVNLYFHDAAVYDGLIQLVGKGNVSRFIENMLKPLVLHSDLADAYQAMAQDSAREKEAIEWINGTSGDIAHESW